MPHLAALLTRVHAQDGYPVEGVADPIAWLVSERLLGAWVAEITGEIVGHVALSQADETDDAARIFVSSVSGDLDSVAVLGRLFVNPEARGHRLGQRLAITATQYSEALGKRAVLDVMAKDRAAIRTYENLGWRRLAAIEHSFADGTAPGFAYVSPENGTARGAL